MRIEERGVTDRASAKMNSEARKAEQVLAASTPKRKTEVHHNDDTVKRVDGRPC